jgi:hypothetical protein
MTTSQELPSSSSSFTFEEKNQEMTTSWKACHHLLHLRKKLRNDDKPLGSPLFVTPEKKKQGDDDEPRRFVVICYT